MCYFFFFKQKTAYELRISDWSSDVCSSDLWPIGMTGPFHSMSWRIAARLSSHMIAWRRHLSTSRFRQSPHCPSTYFVLSIRARRTSCVVTPAYGGGSFQIGKASCRERVCQYMMISVVAVPLKKKNTK